MGTMHHQITITGYLTDKCQPAGTVSILEEHIEKLSSNLRRVRSIRHNRLFERVADTTMATAKRYVLVYRKLETVIIQYSTEP